MRSVCSSIATSNRCEMRCLAGTAADRRTKRLRPSRRSKKTRREYQPEPVKSDEEVTELVGLCLWDVFSDNHDVIAADGRISDIGSFRGAGAFLDEHLARSQDSWREGD